MTHIKSQIEKFSEEMKDPKEIRVINPQIIKPMEIELNKLSDAELAAELKRRNEQKNNDREAYKSLVEENVPKNLEVLLEAAKMLSEVKTKVFKDFQDTIKLKTKIFGVKSKQQSHTFSCNKGEITIGYRVNDGWDDTVNEGIQKVNNYITSLAKDEESANLVEMIYSLLKKDAKGNLKSNRVLDLIKLANNSNSEDFKDGVKIISEAHKPVKSVWFIEAYTINESNQKEIIPLNISSAGFSNNFIFDFNE